MNYVKSFDLFGVPAMQIPATPGSGAPTTETEGAVGCLYMDTDTGKLYKCIAVADGVYTWNENGAGLSRTEKGYLLTLFKNAIYNADVSNVVNALEALWNSGSGDSGDSGGGEVSIYTIVYNLSNVNVSNDKATVDANTVYSATLTPADGYELETVVVTMGGVDITTTAYVNGVISIAEVTGNLVITATAVESIVNTGDLATDSWSAIAANSANASEVYAIGDTKDITLSYADGSTATLTTEIVGFNHDDLADGSGKAGITFKCIVSVNLPTHVYDSTDCADGWDGSEIRGYCNGELFEALPVELQAVIKTVSKKSCGGTNNKTLVTSADKLFLTCPEEEIESYGDGGGHYMNGEGTLYEKFIGATAVATNRAAAGWFRSASKANSGYAIGYTKDYGTNSFSKVATELALAFAFCV